MFIGCRDVCVCGFALVWCFEYWFGFWLVVLALRLVYVIDVCAGCFVVYVLVVLLIIDFYIGYL